MPAGFWARAPVAIALGLLATFAQAPFGQVWAAPLALAGMFALLQSQAGLRSFTLGWLFALTHFASGVYWIYIATHLFGHAPVWLGVLLTGLLTGVMALYPAAALALGGLLRGYRSPSGFWLLPALWVLAELLRGFLFHGGFPWLSMGYAALDTPLTRAAPLVGVYGLSALIVLWAMALFRLATAPGYGRAVAAALLLLPFGCALLPRPDAWTQASAAPLKVALIQANVGEEHKWDEDQVMPLVQRYRDQTLAVQDADLIIWPEDALPLLWPDAYIVLLKDLDRQLAARRQTLIAGVLTPFPLDEGRAGIYNSAVFLGQTHGRYDKRHLVPFGEFFPVPDFLRRLFDVLGTPFSDFTPGAPNPPILTVRGVTIALSICFEDVFPEAFRHDAQRAGILVNITNDAWYGHSSALSQHLAFSRMRAIESARWLARATPTGISAIIDPNGVLSQRAPKFVQETVSASMEPRSGVTPFDRYGDTPLWFLATTLILFRIGMLWIRTRS